MSKHQKWLRLQHQLLCYLLEFPDGGCCPPPVTTTKPPQRTGRSCLTEKVSNMVLKAFPCQSSLPLKTNLTGFGFKRNSHIPNNYFSWLVNVTSTKFLKEVLSTVTKDILLVINSFTFDFIHLFFLICNSSRPSRGHPIIIVLLEATSQDYVFFISCLFFHPVVSRKQCLHRYDLWITNSVRL